MTRRLGLFPQDSVSVLDPDRKSLSDRTATVQHEKVVSRVSAQNRASLLSTVQYIRVLRSPNGSRTSSRTSSRTRFANREFTKISRRSRTMLGFTKISRVREPGSRTRFANLVRKPTIYAAWVWYS